MKSYQSKMFWHTTIRPFLEPFKEIPDHIITKILFGLAWLGTWLLQIEPDADRIIALGMELLIFPIKLWIGLNMLILCDFIAGTGRAIFDSKIDFTLKRWTRTAYKMAAYNAACLIMAIVTNMFPDYWWVLQFVIYFLLSGQEVYSGFRHLGVLSYLFAAVEAIKSGQLNFQTILKFREQKREKEFKKYQKKFDFSDN